MKRIFIEYTPAAFASSPYGHLYLVYRDILNPDTGLPFAGDDTFPDDVADTAEVIRGGVSDYPGPLEIRTNIDVISTEQNGEIQTRSLLLSDTNDSYRGNGNDQPVTETPNTRGSFDLTELFLENVSQLTEEQIEQSLSAIWIQMSVFANSLNGQYDYELFAAVFGSDTHVANSNSVIFTVLNEFDIDLRDIPTIQNSPFASEFPGAFEDAQTTTIIGSSESEEINTSSEVLSGVNVLGRDGVNDVISGSQFSDNFFGEQEEGGNNIDTVTYAEHNQGILIKFDTPNDNLPIEIQDGSDNGDLAFGIEKIIGTKFTDFVDVNAILHEYNKELHISLGDDVGVDDIVDFSDVAGGIFTFGSIEIKNDELLNSGLSFSGVDYYILSGGDDVLIGHSDASRIDGGSGNDEIVINASIGNDKIYGGSGNDTLQAVGESTEIYGGSGENTYYFGNNSLLADVDSDDVISFFGDYDLTGGFRYRGSESAFARGQGGFEYGINDQDQLVIRNVLLRDFEGNPWEIFLADANVGPEADLADRTAGLLVFEKGVTADHLRNPGVASAATGTFKTQLGFEMKALYGESAWRGVDPLVFDLDDDGFELTNITENSPFFDLDGDGFSEQSGWISSGDAFLVRDLNANGAIDDVSEMFGGSVTGGFAALEAFDGNGDDLINSSDAVFTELQLWIDDGDGVTEAGELVTLASQDVVSISLVVTDVGSIVAGNVVERTANFTRSDASTGNIADVTFQIDNYDSDWLGDDNVDSSVTSLVNLKGHGTLVDLHVAMSLEIADSGTSALKTVIENTVPTLDIIDLVQLRENVRPLLQAWAEAPPNGGIKSNPDIAILIDRDGGVTDVSDYAIKFTDGTDTWYELASGNLVEIGGSTINFPSFQDVLDQDLEPGTTAEWEVLLGTDISFLERYMGEEVPVEVLESGDAESGAVDALSNILEVLAGRIDALAVSLAAQGPLSTYFDELEYALESDLFEATGTRELTPFFEAVFTDAPADSAGAENWLIQWQPIVNTVLDNFQRAEGHQKVTHSYIFANIVAAHENTSINVTIETAADLFGMPEDLLNTAAEAAGDTVSSGNEVGIFYVDDSVASGGGGLRYEGGLGDDAYIVGARFDGAVIDDEEQAGSPQVADILRFAQHAPDDLAFSRVGRDLVIADIATGDVLTVEAHFTGVKPNLVGGANLNSDRGVTEIVFVDGTVWNRAEIAEAVAVPEAGDQEIVGTDDMDVLDGGTGNDTLSGGDEGDVYVFDAGYGQDRIDDQAEFVLQDAPDFVRFGTGLSSDDLLLSREGNGTDLTMTFAGSTDSLVIEDQFDALYTDVLGVQWLDRIEFMTFMDGDFLTWESIMQRMVREAASDGDDVIWGFAYEDTIDGGAGDDLMGGGNENDTYRFGQGDGNDVIRESIDASYSVISGQHDVVVFDVGISIEDLSLSRVGGSDDVTISLADGSSLTIDGQFDATATGVLGIQWLDRIEEFRFTAVDGTVTSEDAAWLIESLIEQATTGGDDIVHGFDTADTLDGGAGDDLLIGGNAGDIYRYAVGEGDDTIADGSLNNLLFGLDDVIEVSGASADDVIVTRNGTANDLVLSFGAAGTGSLTLRDQLDANPISFQSELIERIDFVDHPGESLSEAELRQLYFDEAASAGDDSIIGFYSNDTLEGGTGDDCLAGGNGSDTYLWSLGDGNDTIAESVTHTGFSEFDRLEFGADIDLENIQFLRSGGSDDLQIEITDTLGGGTSVITVEGQFHTLGGRDIEEIEFADGTVLTEADIRGLLDQSSDGDDRIFGFDSDDSLNGGAGNDFLQGGKGSDTYHFSGAFGRDTIEDHGEGLGRIDVLDFNNYSLDDASFERASAEESGASDDLVIWFASTGSEVTVVNGLNPNSDFDKIESFVFLDATLDFAQMRQLVLDHGDNAGNGLIIDFSGSQSSVLSGNEGDDFLRGGAGNDTYVFSAGDGRDVIDDSSGNDILELYGIDPADVEVTRPTQDSDSDADDDWLLILGNGDEIVIKDAHTNSGSRIETITFDDSLNTVWTIQDLENAFVDDVLVELGGTSGADTLDASSRTNVSDDLSMTAGSGSDRYEFAAGDGDTFINDSGGSDDRLIISGYNDDDVTFSRLDSESEDLLLRFSGSDERIVIHDELRSSTSHRIEHIEFVDSSTVWDIDDIWQSVVDHATTTFDDWIEGFVAADDTLSGGLGDDTLYGRKGSDTYIFRQGDGRDEINDNGDGGTDILLIEGYGIGEIEFQRRVDNSDNLKIHFTSSDDSILIVNQLDRHFTDHVEEVYIDVEGDGTVDFVLDADAVEEKILESLSTDGDDSIIGFTHNDGETLEGGLGNDTLSGRDGADTYIFGVGDGADWIHEAGLQDDDRLVLEGRDRADVFVSRHPLNTNHLVLTFAEAGDRVVIENTLDSNSEDEVEFIDFETDPSWSTADILSLLGGAAPVATVDDQFLAVQNQSISIDARTLLANDSDADLDLAIDNAGTHVGQYGTLTLNADGGYSYALDEAHADVVGLQAGESLQDTFGYAAANGDVTDAGTVTISIVSPDDGPRLLDDDSSLDLLRDDSIEGNVLANDGDDADTLTMSSVGFFQGEYGSLSLFADGSYVYRVDRSNSEVSGLSDGAVLADSFSYRLTDEAFVDHTASLTVTIAQQGSGPQAIEDRAIIVRGAGSALTGSVLDNDRDGAADQLSLVSVFDASTGNVSVDGDGMILFTPGAGFTGVASFSYLVTDGLHRADVGTVTIDVVTNDAPIGVDDSGFVLTLGGSAVTASTRLLLNDSDADGDALIVSAVQNASGLAASLTVDGDVAISSDGRFAGLAGYDYVVEDGRGATATAHASVIVGVSTDNDTLTGTVDDDAFHGLDGDDVLSGDTGNDGLWGDGGNDTLIGGEGNDTLDGGDGDDFLTGGTGGDSLVGGDGVDTLSYADETAGMSLLFGFMMVGAWSGDVIASDIEVLVASSGNDQLNGQMSFEEIHGGAGVDSLVFMSHAYGGDGDDILVAGTSGGVLHGDDGADALTGSNLADALYGGAGNDTFVLGDGSDTLAANADSVDGGTGIDMVRFAGTVGVTADMSGTGVDGHGLEGIEILSGSYGDDSLTTDDFSRELLGNDGNDTLTGGAGFDTLHGGRDRDLLAGGAGDDLLFGGYGGDAGDTLQGGIGNDTLHGESFQSLLEGGDGDDVLYGAAYGTLRGGSGDDSLVAGIDDTLFGGAGADTFVGGAGIDVVSYADATAAVALDIAAGGTVGDANGDIVDTAIEKIIGSDYDDTLSADDTTRHLYGELGADVLGGGAQTDWLYGGDGGDSLAGLGGSDIVYGGLASDTLDGGAGDDVLRGDEGNDSLSGGEGADNLGGGIGDDTVEGGDGNDTIWADAGADLIGGGNGDDWLDYSNALVGVAVSNRVGTSGWAQGDTIGADVELIRGTQYADTLIAGSMAEHFYGEAGDDIFIGGQGDDLVFGGDGQDSLTLGDGDDWAYGRDGDDTIDGGAGADGIWGGQGNDVLTDLSGTAYLDGDEGDDSLTSGDSDDRLFGDEGQDTLEAGDGFDTIDAGSGDDVVFGGGGDDEIDGGAGNDSIQAGDGDDTIVDGIGLDSVFGGAGEDVLRFGFLTDGSLLDLTSGSYVIGADIETLEGSDFSDEFRLDTLGRTLFAEDGNDTIVGSAASDTVNGGLGDDSITAGAGNDSIEGNIGNDTIWGGSGDDSLSGGHGDNVVYGEDGNDTLIAGSGNDALLGGLGNDFIYSGQGNDHVEGNDGDDVINGYEGLDTLYGGDGNDTLLGEEGDDELYGGAGNDSLSSGDGSDLLFGGAGFDTLKGYDENDTIYGGADGDELDGRDGDDVLDGGTGDDSIEAGLGDDSLIGGEGADTLKGREGSDTLLGDEGNDELYGHEGNDLLQGGSDDDYLDGGDDDDTLIGGAGTDDLRGRAGADSLEGGSGDDFLAGYEGNDSLFGGSDADYLDGGDDHDLLSGGAGDDDLRGRTGDDDLQGGDGSDSLFGHEGNDTLSGGDSNDTLYGGSGSDSLVGDDGDDRLNGNEGDDILVGGLGDDLFDFQLGSGQDIINDFAAGTGGGDVIDVSDYSFVDFADLLSAADDGGGTSDVVIALDGSNQVTLLGVQVIDLDSADFIYT